MASSADTWFIRLAGKRCTVKKSKEFRKIFLVPRLCLGTHDTQGSALPARVPRWDGEAEPRGSAFPGGAWERGVSDPSLCAPTRKLRQRRRPGAVCLWF